MDLHNKAQDREIKCTLSRSLPVPIIKPASVFPIPVAN
jgi:hypothetical protein